ncbi:MAG: TerC/Alx family metal homeostasis membrane protein [Calditerrivibrio sp.]|nr:TerC/Alx family metal homeostasis membrane protein [Calditerrivibrio sp.]
MHHTLGWVVFTLIILVLLLLDLVIFNRKAHVITLKESLAYSSMWIAIAFVFNIGLYYFNGDKQAIEFLTGYIIEKSLSIDNIFVMILIFQTFQIPSEYQHKILFLGIIGAIILRAIMIFVGISLVERFHFIFYIFGLLLIFNSIKMAFKKEEEEIDFESKWFFKRIKNIYPIANNTKEGRFFVLLDGKKHATQILIALLVIEFSDIMFAMDSIPAIFGITTDPFIVFSSNIFAILGLRSLYFALAGIMGIFHFIKYGLSIILGFIGVKMLIANIIHIPTIISLITIIAVLSISILFSLLFPKVIENK